MRGAYALDAVDWRLDGLCGDNPDMWSSESWTKRTAAAHACSHCPVLADCRRDLEHTPKSLLSGVVVAGVAHSATGKPIAWPQQKMTCWRCADDLVLSLRGVEFCMTSATQPTTALDAALKRIAAILDRRDVGSQVRMVAWLWEVYVRPEPSGEAT